MEYSPHGAITNPRVEQRIDLGHAIHFVSHTANKSFFKGAIDRLRGCMKPDIRHWAGRHDGNAPWAVEVPADDRYSKRGELPQSSAMTCRSIVADTRLPGEIKCFSRRNPCQGIGALERTIRVGPGVIA